MEDAGMLAGGEIELFEQRPVPRENSFVGTAGFSAALGRSSRDPENTALHDHELMRMFSWFVLALAHVARVPKNDVVEKLHSYQFDITLALLDFDSDATRSPPLDEDVALLPVEPVPAEAIWVVPLIDQQGESVKSRLSIDVSLELKCSEQGQPLEPMCWMILRACVDNLNIGFGRVFARALGKQRSTPLGLELVDFIAQRLSPRARAQHQKTRGDHQWSHAPSLRCRPND